MSLHGANGIRAARGGRRSWTSRSNQRLFHLHVLMVDGVFVDVGGNPLFRNLSAMTDAEVASLAESIPRKVLAVLVLAGLLNEDGEVVTNPDCDEMFRDHEALAASSSASIAGKSAFGPNAGRHVTKVGSGFGYYEETPLAKRRLS